MRCLNKSGKLHTYNRHSLESIEVTRGNTATHPPNYIINGQQRQTTVNSANLYYDPTLRLRSLQPDQIRTLPNGDYQTNNCFLVTHLLLKRIQWISVYIVYYRSDDVLAMFYHCDGIVVQRSPRQTTEDAGLKGPRR